MVIVSIIVGIASIVAAGILTAKVGNPLLDKLIIPASEADDDDDKQQRLIEEQTPFDPNQTDVLGYKELGFVKPEVDKLEMDIGISFIISQSFPNWLTYLIDTYTSAGDFKKNVNKDKYETKSVDIMDARKRSSDDLNFNNTGFTLLKMKEPSKTSNWRSATDIQHFQEEILPELMKLFPGATRIEFTHNIVRGGDRLGDQPASINGPHLDYSQNDLARKDFHDVYPINENVKEQLALMGKWDSEDEEVKTLIGIWKPIHMNNPVYDHPLALMDASTFQSEQERPHHLHFNFGIFTMHNLNGGFCYNENQKWYYYPYQTETEVLVFTQYSKGKHFANPHTSFLVPNRPKDEEYDTRQSIEMRAAVFYPKN